MRAMNSSEASVTPTPMATVRSTKTVRPKVTSRTERSLLGMRSSARNRAYSLMPQATMKRIAANAAIGTKAMISVANTMTSNRNTACMMPAIGVFAPERILVAVRAIAPVAGRPPNSAEPRLAIPCPINSWLERWRVPTMPSATTADSKASMPARNAMVNAEGRTA